MANCSVLESHQQNSDKPFRRIKKAGGESLVRQQRADWVIRGVLLKMRSHSEIPAKTPAVPSEYIPFGLEPLIDARIGVIDLSPALPNQSRFRHV